MGILSFIEQPAAIMIGLPAICYAAAGLAFVGYSLNIKGEALARRVDALRPRPKSARAVKRDAASKPAPVFRLSGKAAGELRAQEFVRLLHLPPKHAAAAFFAFRAALGMFLAASLLLLGYRWHGDLSPPTAAGLAACGIGIAWLVPLLLIETLLARRTRTIENGLPEAIELLIIAVEAGLALEDAIDRIVPELQHSRPLIAEQLALTSADLKILPDRQLALAKLAERVDLPSVRSVVTTLTQTMRYGTPLAQALRVVATELRNDSLLRLEARANKMPVMLTIPMVLFILPSLFLLLGGPVVLKFMRTVFPS
jgi:tight adherence protein C